MQLVICALFCFVLLISPASARPGRAILAILPSNPAYFTGMDGKPLLLVGNYAWGTLTEPNYDYSTSFDTLKKNNLNFARVWLCWGSEEIGKDGRRRYITPWQRVGPDKALDGGPKYDLYKWDDFFFTRLRDVCSAAQKRGIHLQLCLLDAWGLKHERRWNNNAFHRDNNINGVDGDPNKTGVGTDGYKGFCSMLNPAATAAQKAYVKKVVETVNSFDNIFYEIANENYYNEQWERHLCEFIHDCERTLPKKHLAMPLDLPNHDYGGIKTWDRKDLHTNLVKARKLKQPLIFDTDGILYPDDAQVRRAAWTAVMSGGHVDYLDESLQPGGRNPGDFAGSKRADLRRQMGYLSAFAGKIRIWDLHPDDFVVKSGEACVLTSATEMYIYLPENAAIIDLASMPGTLKYRWYDVVNDKWFPENTLQGGSKQSFQGPRAGDWVLYLHR